MKKYALLFVLSLSLIPMLFGCGRKPAEPMALPAVDEIESIDITTFDGSQVSCSDKEWIEHFLSVLIQAKATTKESVQDNPDADIYGEIEISNNGGVTTVFYYEDHGKYCIEQPYQGIYETDTDIDTLAKGVE